MFEENEIVITLDIDWAPDFVVYHVANLLLDFNVHATFFVTHPCSSVNFLHQHSNLFELGIHPNFSLNSTQGDTEDSILKYCMNLVPNAISVRSHSLIQSTPLLRKIMKQTPIVCDASLYLPHTPSVRPVEFWWQNRMLLRIPFIWEDDLEMDQKTPCWSLSQIQTMGNGLKVFNFHPIHIFLNSVDMDLYYKFRGKVSCLQYITQSEMDTHLREGRGTRMLFMELLKYLSTQNRSYCLRDIYNQWHEHIKGNGSE